MAVKKKTTSELPLDDGLQAYAVPTLPSIERKASKEKEVPKTASVESLKVQSIERIQEVFDTLIKETIAVEDLKRKSKEEMELEKRQAKQHEEQESFTILLTERKRKAEFDEKLEKEKKSFEEEKIRKEDELKVREVALEAKMNELEDLRVQVQQFPIKLSKAVEDAKKQVGIDLKKDFDNEKAMLVQKYTSEAKLLDQQIVGLQNQNKQQEKEVIYSAALEHQTPSGDGGGRPDDS